MEWHRWWRYWSDDEDSEEERQRLEEEKWKEDPVLKEHRILKSKHERALNAVSLAEQVVANAPEHHSKDGEKSVALQLAEKKIDKAKTAVIKAENKFLEFSKSKDMEPYTGKILSRN